VKNTLSEFKNLSPRNFALAADRLRMQSALKSVRDQLGVSVSLRSGSHSPEKLKSHQTVSSLNPSNKAEVVGTVQIADAAAAEEALRVCAAGAKAWNKTDPWERIRLVEKLADWLTERRDLLSAWMVFEVGKNWREADGDTCEAIDFCRYYAREMARLASPRRTQNLLGEANDLFYRPRGVGVVIAPWNFPLAIFTGMSVATLVTGNTVILKPAEQSPVIASFLAQGLKEVGFPADSFYFLPGSGEQIGPILVQDERVDMICFTGSVDVGLSIIESAAKKPGPLQKGVKRVVAEMGGKNALIVDEDADLDEAVIGAIGSAFNFQGQKCSAMSRLIVHEKVYDEFVERFVAATKSLRIGPATNQENQIGPVIDEAAQRRILKTINEARARLQTFYIGENVPAEGYFVPPAIFEVTDISDPLFQNEIFGPVVAVLKVRDLDRALEALNSVRFALTGGIYSRSPSHIEKAKREAEVGNFYVNRSITGAVVERQPFGGFKLSGVGSKAGGPDYLIQFMEPRVISENTVRRGFAAEDEASTG